MTELQQRLPSKVAREMHKTMTDLGYWLARTSGGHLVYKHATQPSFTFPASPSDHRSLANDTARLKRRHPNYFAARRDGAPVPRRANSAASSEPTSVAAIPVPREIKEQVRTVLALAPPTSRPQPEPRAIPQERPERTSCIDCGNPWLSDIPPTGRACARCGGEIVLGPEPAEFPRKPQPVRQPWEAA